VGFEPTIPAFEREKTVHALDGAATVIDNGPPGCIKFGDFPEYLSDNSFLEMEYQLRVIYVDKFSNDTCCFLCLLMFAFVCLVCPCFLYIIIRFWVVE
jgi:hypothetical protein